MEGPRTATGRSRARAATALALGLALAGGSALAEAPASTGTGSDAVARGDAAWARRAEGSDGTGRAARGPIDAAIAAYAEALRADPDDLEAHWRQLRALHFAGEFACAPGDAQQAFFDRGVDASRAAFEALDRRSALGTAWSERAPQEVGAAFDPAQRPAVARIHFWSAVVWGAWTRYHGLLATVREGVAGGLKRRADVVVALEPGLEHGGAHRLLATLHARLPAVPFLTGWVDRDRALVEIERANAIAPDFPGNRLLTALLWLDLAPDRRDEAQALLEQVAGLEPDPDERVEQLALREEARARLAADEAGAR